MAQDYHIYIHDSKGGSGNGNGNQTTPFSTEKESSFSTQVLDKASQVKSIVNGGAISTGAAAMTKVFPVAAIAIAIAKTADKILTTAAQHIEDYRGDYTRSVEMENIHTALSFGSNPVGFFKRVIHRQFQIDKANKQIAEERKLMGTSILKDMKVGI